VKNLQHFVVLDSLMGKMKKKEKTMTPMKVLGWIILVLVAIMFLSSGPRLFASDVVPDFQQQDKAAQQQKKEQEKEKQAEKEEDLGDSMKKRMDQGESLFDIIGIPSAEDYMPTTFEVVLLWLIPFSVIVAVVILIVIISKRRHQRVLAMIEKGILPDANAISHYKANQFRWDVFLLLTGLILGLGGIGLSVFMMGHKGTEQWYTGVIPFLVGVALLIFYQIFYRKKKE
jgi:cytochrome c-type biogenesis protein CcmH/NrfF